MATSVQRAAPRFWELNKGTADGARAGSVHHSQLRVADHRIRNLLTTPAPALLPVSFDLLKRPFLTGEADLTRNLLHTDASSTATITPSAQANKNPLSSPLHLLVESGFVSHCPSLSFF